MSRRGKISRGTFYFEWMEIFRRRSNKAADILNINRWWVWRFFTHSSVTQGDIVAIIWNLLDKLRNSMYYFHDDVIGKIRVRGLFVRDLRISNIATWFGNVFVVVSLINIFVDFFQKTFFPIFPRIRDMWVFILWIYIYIYMVSLGLMVMVRFCSLQGREKGSSGKMITINLWPEEKT